MSDQFRRRDGTEWDGRDCKCEDDELYQLAKADHDSLAALNIIEEHFGRALVVCKKVLDARAEKNKDKESNALPNGKRWGRRNPGVPALTYVVANYLNAIGFDGPRHLSVKERKREITRLKNGGFAKSWKPSAMIAKAGKGSPDDVSS